MPKKVWTVVDIPSQDGKTAIVTGATGGLGYETALALAKAGASVILAGRNETKGQEAVEKLKSAFPEAKVSFEKLDLGNLASVKEFAEKFNSKTEALDILVNNAGVMMPPKREVTSDGFELQFGTNHLGHFALTAQLIPSLRRSSQPRVVNVSSGAANQGKINFDDLQWTKSYPSWGSYGQSKLANLLFTSELQKRSEAGNWKITAYSAHPGYSRTDLITSGPGTSSFFARASGLIRPFLSQDAASGALPTLYAATAAEAQPGGYYGPQGFMELKGPPGPAGIPRNAKDPEVAKKLWDISTELTCVSWPTETK